MHHDFKENIGEITYLRDSDLQQVMLAQRTDTGRDDPETSGALPNPFVYRNEDRGARDGVHARQQTVSSFYLVLRGTIDILFGLLGSLILLGLFPVIALLLVLDSPGPIFYRQERVGYQGKPFRIFKFRTMHVNAEASGQAIWAAEQDTRVTRVGRFMRAVHLDELPQVFNILRGEMSLIGPRPERAAFTRELEEQLPFYLSRLTVKPGLTGWAQVNYHYAGNIEDYRIKLQYDLYYIDHQSLRLDLLILLRTVKEIVMRRGR